MNQLAFEALADAIKREGPSRVLLEANGNAVSPNRAPEEWAKVKEHGVVFIRKDGWSLAAREELLLPAMETWDDQWIGMISFPSGDVTGLLESTKLPKLGEEPLVRVPLEIDQFMHCSLCVEEHQQGKYPGQSAASMARLNVGFTSKGIQIWCERHQINVLHMSFQGLQHPALLDGESTEERLAGWEESSTRGEWQNKAPKEEGWYWKRTATGDNEWSSPRVVYLQKAPHWDNQLVDTSWETPLHTVEEQFGYSGPGGKWVQLTQWWSVEVQEPHVQGFKDA